MTDTQLEQGRAVRSGRKSSRGDKIRRKATSGTASSRKQRQLGLEIVPSAGNALIHDAVLKILWEVGVIIDHPPTQEMLVRDHDCREGADGYVRIPPDLVNQAISTVPDAIRLYDQNGVLRVDTGGNTSNYVPGHNCVRILDHRTKTHRPCLLEDIGRTGRVCEQLPNLDMSCSLGYPSDVPAQEEAVLSLKALTTHCSKPAAFTAHDEVLSEKCWSYLADVSGGWNNLADKPIGLELLGPVSPLKLPDEFCMRVINCARWRVPLVCYPATFPGMSSPITTAGAIAQSSAEAMAGIVIHQLTEPGAPVMSGSAILPMDMRQADLAYGSPEYMLTGLGAADYFKSIGIPAWVGAGCSDSHDFDAQAASEAGANMAIAVLASTPFIHNLGYLSGGRTGSLEMLVLCDELVGWANQMAAGVVVDPDTVAIEVVRRAAPDNAFLTDQHTQDRYLTENWFPSLYERSDVDAWLERGSVDMRARIAQKLDEILAD